MDIPLIVVLAVLGALLGSFGCAQVWRLRARQLVEDKEEYDELKSRGESPDRDEYYQPAELKQLRHLIRPVKGDRSECLACNHQLAWYDLIPVMSWLSLGGRCRYCRTPIGVTEVFAEIGLAAVFVVSYLAWPYQFASIADIALFSLWVVICLMMQVLFIYDAKWSLLPFKLNVALIAVSLIFASLSAVLHGVDLWSLVGAIALLSGLYAVFAAFRWSGFGDSILGLALALVLADWQLAFLTLFLANVLGCLMLIPLYLRKQLHRNLRVPFGPFLIIATLIAFLWGNELISWFMSANNALFMSLML